jgi:cobalt/nickel transport protein
VKRIISTLSAAALLLGVAATAWAHFGMVIPNKPMLAQGDKAVDLTISFSHPMEMVGMDMVKPKNFAVYVDGKPQDLLGSLTETKVMDHKAWKASYAVKKPGVYIFAVEPQPYPEPAEDNYIIHYTKTVVAAFGDEDGWDADLGLKAEIVPLSRPFGNYAGNVFQGVVKFKGKPVPNCDVEVEMYNKDGKYEAPTEYMVTQVVKTDQNGVFTYACPKAGWWGFAALNADDEKINGKEVEVGAVLWIYMHDFKTKK